MLYLFIILLLFVSIYQYDYLQRKKGREVAYIIFLLMFILVAGLRYRIGLDTIRYESSYSKMPTIFEITANAYDSSRWDPAFFTLASLSKTISSDFIVLQLIQAAFVNLVIFHFFKRYTTNRFLALFIYFIFLYFNFMCEVMRESCAVACLLLSYPYYLKHNWLVYYIFSVLAILFHTSAIITIFLPILTIPIFRQFFTVGKRTIFLLAGVFILGSAIRIALFDYLQAFTMMERLQDKAIDYADSDQSDSVYNIKGILSLSIKYIIYPILALILLKRNRQYGYNTALNTLVIMGVYTAIISIPIAILSRFLNYFFPFMIITICDISFRSLNIKHKIYKLTFSSWIIILVPWLFLRTYEYKSKVGNTGISEYSRYYPYESRLFPEKNKTRERLFNYYNAD